MTTGGPAGGGAAAPVLTDARYRYDERDVILYALGCGARDDELHLLCELVGGLRVLPTFATVPMGRAVIDAVERLGVDPRTVLHVAQSLRCRAPLPAEGAELSTTVTVDGRDEQDRDVLLRLRTTVCDSRGVPLADGVSTLLCREAGGPGAERATSAVPPAVAGSPGWRGEVVTAPTQALLFRLNGDRNPAHVLPDAAARVGYPGRCCTGSASTALPP